MTDLVCRSLAPLHFTPLTLSAIKPQGWLRDQLRIQAEGLSGHLDEFWPSVADSRWIGGNSEGWERGPYWLDGIVPLAFLLDDERLKAKAQYWIDTILAAQRPDGWLDEKNSSQSGEGEATLDPWPLFVLFKAFAQWHEATGDPRILPVMTRALQRIETLLREKPLESWAKMRWPDLVVSIAWLYRRTGNAELLPLADLAQSQGYDWREHFADFQYTEKQPRWTLENHVVNHAMALKAPAVRYIASGNANATDEEREAAKYAIATLDRWHGMATGTFTGDESLAGLSPSQGTELCSVVEYLYSLEHLIATFGDGEWGDRLERIAYNALPATFKTDIWAHQYDQQVNQVVCKLAPDGERVYTNNDADANLFGLEPHFGCCTANMHQGWPKFVSHLWMSAPNGGLAAIAYGPCEVSTTVRNGQSVTLTEETEYPFRNTISFTVRTAAPVRFPLLLRVPAWTSGATVMLPDGTTTALVPDASGFASLDREWQDGDTATLTLPMSVRSEPRPNGAVSILRGPLLFGLRIGEKFQQLRGELPHADWEVYPTTPWNYGLALQPDGAEISAFVVRESGVSALPFDPVVPPVILTAPARRLPEWGLEKSAAAPPPSSPVLSSEPLKTVELIPYGSTHLRVGEFPTVT